MSAEQDDLQGFFLELLWYSLHLQDSQDKDKQLGAERSAVLVAHL